MESNDILANFICSIENEEEHFLEKPICLNNCGHYVCKSCIGIGSTTKIKCKCGVITEKDFRNDKESSALKNMIKFYLNNIYDEVAKRATEKLTKLKGT